MNRRWLLIPPFLVGLAAAAVIPLATCIAFGLMASTVLVLLVLPSLYAILSDLGWASNDEPVSLALEPTRDPAFHLMSGVPARATMKRVKVEGSPG